jgi:hypothetical protein
MTRAGRSPIIVATMSTTIDPHGADRRSAASIIERETEHRIERRERRTPPLLALLGAAVTAVVALAAAGALLA